MKKTAFVLLIVTALITHKNGIAQTALNPWEFALGINFVDLYPSGDDPDRIGETGGFLESFFNFGDHWNIGAPSLRIGRYVSSGFSLGIQGSLNNISKIEGVTDPSYSYYSADAYVDFSPLQKNKFRPFLKFGYGLTNLEKNSVIKKSLLSRNASQSYFYGLGLELLLNDHFTFGLESTFRNAYEKYSPNHFQHQIMLSYHFGSIDSDGDGVPDKKDACPQEPGLKQYDGCPDTDGDTVIDKEDLCPEIPGLPELKGCLDTDGDGVIDTEDRCPERKGTVEMQGCPDTDQDGISDQTDQCIDQQGPIENNGCPWPDSDGDGIPDKDDLCKDEPGLETNNGCPELAKEIIETLNEIGSRINFAANSDRILGGKTIAVLEEIKKVLIENPKGKLIIEGYASADGETNYNYELSVKRAEAVREYLVARGISVERLEVRGFGEEDPLSSNDNPKGRAQNRRVQFIAKKEKKVEH